MATFNNEIHIAKPLLVWPMPISDKVADLFTMVSVNLCELLKYVSKEIVNTDQFHLIIPLDCLEDLMNDPVSEFSQVQRIDVYYDDIGDLEEIKRRLNLKCERVHFYSVHDLPRRLASIGCDNALISSDLIDRNTIHAIISSIKDRIYAKRFITSARYSQMLKTFSSNFLHGFPVKNIDEINSCFICSSCKLVFKQLYQLECGNRKCIVCLNIQKSYTTCSTVVPFDQEFQNVITSCLSCQWRGSLEAYQWHFKENHHELFTCLVRNLQVDDDNYLLSSDLPITSFNGAGIWEVSGINAIINNAAVDRQKSIYSSPFYLYPNGYKISLRIFLNGDAKARDKYISIFFILMRGDYDTDLQWPFKFKIKFTLLNQLSSNYNQSNSFWPDTTSICFQRPRSNMNIAYGISKFFPLDQFKKNQTQYVQNDTIFIRAEVDFWAERPSKMSLLLADAGELPSEEELADRTYDNLPGLLGDPGAL